MHEPDWDDLKVFLAVSRGGSLAAAARALQVNHSTVLRRLNKLEDDLGTRLFARDLAGYAMTPAGELLAGQLDGVGELIEAAQRQLAGRDAELSGPLRVTTTDTLAYGLLMPVLANFRLRHPRIELQVVINNSFLSLTRREADVAIRPAAEPPEHLVGRRAGRLQTAPYAARAYLERMDAPPEAHWPGHAWVVPDESLSHLAQARWAIANVPADRCAVRADSLVAMAQAVRYGMGAGMLLCMLGDADDSLVRLAEPDPALDTPVWLLTHPDLRHSGRVRALNDFVMEALRQSPWVLAD
ncbi:DNA-binding transcriptional regulator, LysR family [Cupriavidus sp. YR651]|uniref:LysR family transcriptional regulator n=1 Tax=Cupriavidus sp. YR651 TaxID=1855315 RepID=UPI0008803DA7|nr:LysR family transcriptional regulator [Cupriavidus sp. YR651]SDB99841.1 DNA-binding transcriptional regulator, LysR family [Cupriavidus sp. YR651]